MKQIVFCSVSFLLLLSGCPADPGRNAAVEDGGSARDATIVYQRPNPIVVPEIELPSFSGLPRDTTGRPLVAANIQGTYLSVDENRRDPITSIGRCASIITNCYSPGEREFDACVVYAPRCTTEPPWEDPSPCCPEACADAYEAERLQGTAPMVAFKLVFFMEPDCFPGARELLEGL